jgi:hypothetical protein
MIEVAGGTATPLVPMLDARRAEAMLGEVRGAPIAE